MIAEKLQKKVVFQVILVSLILEVFLGFSALNFVEVKAESNDSQTFHSFDHSKEPDINDPLMFFDGNPRLKEWYKILDQLDVEEISNLDNEIDYYTDSIFDIIIESDTPEYIQELAYEFVDIAVSMVTINDSGEYDFSSIYTNRFNNGSSYLERPMELLYSKIISIEKHFIIPDDDLKLLDELKLSAVKILERGYQREKFAAERDLDPEGAFWGINPLFKEYQERLNSTFYIATTDENYVVPETAEKGWNNHELPLSKMKDVDKQNILNIEKITGHSPHVERVEIFDQRNQPFESNVQRYQEAIDKLDDNDIENYSFYLYDKYFNLHYGEYFKSIHFAVHNPTGDIYRIMGDYYDNPEKQIPFYDLSIMPAER